MGKIESLKKVINQFCARKSYSQFIKGLGGMATHKKAIMNEGFGYTDIYG